VISTVGGIAVEEIDEYGQLKKYPRIYCCGEMVDWDAPTGGYLIQGCVSSGWVVGQSISNEF
jgi:predicted flavoprotein YhiN